MIQENTDSSLADNINLVLEVSQPRHKIFIINVELLNHSSIICNKYKPTIVIVSFLHNYNHHHLLFMTPTLLNKQLLTSQVGQQLPKSNKERQPPASDTSNFEISRLVTNRQSFIHGKLEAVLLLAKKLVRLTCNLAACSCSWHPPSEKGCF